jgi:hypothetical protein
MTVRISRPVIALTTVVAVLLAAVSVYALLSAGQARADSTFSARTVVRYCNDVEAPFPPDTKYSGGAGSCAEPSGTVLPTFAPGPTFTPFTSPTPFATGTATPGPTFTPEPTFTPGPTPVFALTRPNDGLAVSGHADITTQLTIPKGDLNFSNVVTLAPNDQVIASGNTMPAGEEMGVLHSDTTLGLLDGACNSVLGVDFLLFNVQLPNTSNESISGDPRSSSIITYPQPVGTTDRYKRWGAPGAGPIGGGGGDEVIYGPQNFGDPKFNVASQENNAFHGYPSYLLDAFDPDFNPLTHVDGATPPLTPTAVYGGIARVSGNSIPLYFVQFAAGALTALVNSPLHEITTPMGQPSVAVLNDPTVPAAPTTIVDFCSNLQSTTVLLGTGFPDGICNATGASGGHGTDHCTRVTNTSSTGTTDFFLQYAASFRDTDQDGIENPLDACPLNRNVGNVRALIGAGNGDSDSDGIDNACDATSNAGQVDTDLDQFHNRDDNCPQVANGDPFTPTPAATDVPTFTPDPAAQKESELGTLAADNGPGTDSIGDLCDASGHVGTDTPTPTPVNTNTATPVNTNTATPTGLPFQQNNQTIYIGMSNTVGNGRYMTATNLVTKCIGGPDLDHDGYCGATGGEAAAFDSDTGHNAIRHGAWAGATHPALQMDTDGDKISDVKESYLSQCYGSATIPTPLVLPLPACYGPQPTTVPTPVASFFPNPTVTPGAGAPGYTLGSDPVHSCAQTTGPTNTKDEGPWDNWQYDLNDDGQVNGQDQGLFAAVQGKTVDLGFVSNVAGLGNVGIYRFDLNNDGVVNGQDLGSLAPFLGKTCAVALVPAFSQQ